MADMQQTLSLILSARDEASGVLRQVGAQMHALASEAEHLQGAAGVMGLRVEGPEALRAAMGQQLAQIKQFVGQQSEAYRAAAAQQEADVRAARGRQTQEARAQLQAEVAAARQGAAEKAAIAAAVAREQVAEERHLAAERIALARSTAQAQVREVRDGLQQALSALREVAQSEEQVWRSVAAEQVQAARAGRDEDLTDVRRWLAEQTALVKEAAGHQIADMRAAAEAQAEALRGLGLGARPSAGAMQAGADLVREDEREQIEALRAAAQEKEAVVRTTYDTLVRDAQEGLQRELEALKEGTAEQERTLRAAADRAEAEARAAAERRLALSRETLRQEQEEIRLNLTQETAEYRAAGERQAAAAQGAADLRNQAIRAGLERDLSDVRKNLDAQLAALRAQGERATTIVRAAAEREAAAMSDSAAASEHFGGSLERLRGTMGGLLGPFEHIVAMGQQMAVWGIGYQVVMRIVSGLSQMAVGLVTTNADFETMGHTFAAIYGSAGAGQRAVTWLDAFAEKTPATRDEVRQAGLTIASLNDNIGQVMPHLEDLAAIMGVKLPDAAQAFSDAQQGRFEMLQMSLRTTKSELATYGLQLDSSGHVMNNSFVPAFERYTQVRFGEHLAQDARQVRAATQTIAALGVNTKDLMPTLEYVASVMDVKLPAAAQAFGQAFRGNLGPLERMFNLTTQDLERFGLKLDSSGHVVQSTLVPAFLAAAKADFGGTIGKAGAQMSATDIIMNTFAGHLSNVQDEFGYLQRTLGRPLFEVLSNQLKNLEGYLKDPAIVAWAQRTGEALGRVASAAAAAWGHISPILLQLGGAITTLLPRLGPVFDNVARGFTSLWRGIGGTQGAISTLLGVVNNAVGVLGGLWDALHNVWTVLSAATHLIGDYVGLIGNLTGAFRDNEGAVRTVTATIASLVIGLKLFKMAQDLANDTQAAFRFLLETLPAKLGGATQATQRLTAATTDLKDSEVVATAETEATVVALGDLRDKEVVVAAETATATGALNDLGEKEVAVTGTTEATAVALGAGTGLAGEAETASVALGEGGLLGTLGRFGAGLYALAGPLIAVTANFILWGKAIEQAKVDLDALHTVQQLKDIDRQLTPTGAQAGQPVYGMVRERVAHGKAWDWEMVRERVGTTRATTGDVGTFAHSLWPAGPETEAYKAFTLMATGGDPGPWLTYIQQHPDVGARYMQMMQREGRGAQAQAGIAQWQALQATQTGPAGGAGMLPLQTPLQQAQADLAQARRIYASTQKLDPTQALGALYRIKDDMEQIDLLHGRSIQDAVDYYNKRAPALQAAIDAASGAPTSTQPPPTDYRSAHTAAARALSGLKAKWADYIARARTHKITLDQLQADLDALAPQIAQAQYDVSGADVGQTLQDYQDKEKQAYQAIASKLAHDAIRKFTAALKQARLGKLALPQVEALIGPIQTLEAEAGIVDYTDYFGEAEDAVTKYTAGAAKARVAQLAGQFRLFFDRLKHHMRGYTLDMVNALIANIQQVEAQAGLPDTTGMMQQQVWDWQQKQGAVTTRGSPAYNAALVTQGAIDDAKAHLAALIRQHPEQTQAIENLINQIAGPGGLIEQYERAKNVPWPRVLEDEDAARTRLTLEYDRAVGPAKALSDAQARLATDLARLGTGAGDYRTLMADAARVQRDDLAVHHSRAHAERAYTDATRQVGAHMLSGAHDQLTRDLRRLGDAARDYARLLLDAVAVQKDTLLATGSKSKAEVAYGAAVDLADKHMVGLAKSKLADDLANLGRSAQNQKTLLDDAGAVYRWEAQAHKDGLVGYQDAGRAQADLTKNRKLIAKHMELVAAAGPAAHAPTPEYGPYRPFTPQYGATQVFFGGAVQNPLLALVGHLQALVAYWSHRAEQDEQMLQAQRDTAQSSRQTATNTGAIAINIGKVSALTGRTTTPAPGVGANLRGHGHFQPTPH